MKNPNLAFAFLICLVPGLSWAEIKEMSQAELRAAVADNEAIPTRRLISGVENFVGGNVVEIRAFEVDGQVTYRIIIRHDNGQVGRIIVDAGSGREMRAESEVGRQIASLATASSGRSEISGDDRGNDRGNDGRNNGRSDGRSGANGRDNANNGNNGGGKGK